jgi:hypothetical protein
MSATASSSIPSRTEPRSPRRHESRAPRTSVSRADHPADAAVARHGRGGRALFEIPFRSPMSDLDVARLTRLLDLSTHLHQKMRPDPNSPGVARLDHHTGLYLERGDEQGQWVLEGRTWGKPTPERVHEWQLLAALAARQLDPSVRLPERQSEAA